MSFEYEHNDACSKEGALKLCRIIKNFWMSRGRMGIVTSIYEFNPDKPGVRVSAPNSCWGVKSNIGPSGYPPKYA